MKFLWGGQAAARPDYLLKQTFRSAGPDILSDNSPKLPGPALHLFLNRENRNGKRFNFGYDVDRAVEQQRLLRLRHLSDGKL
ncbi:hypothetical protein [Flavonifractor plautii]|uniref:hypothetical protein n=1 Tax=Flavonifractor plautii TaxID=292800 RepID=UPI0013A5FE76|nr:hypothetical protein [Flavonifractor plautii]MCR1920116.1 hypothetical protein [Flavonifractor plautii]